METAPDWRDPMPPGFHWPEGIRAAACFTFVLGAEDVILSDRPRLRHLIGPIDAWIGPFRCLLTAAWFRIWSLIGSNGRGERGV